MLKEIVEREIPNVRAECPGMKFECIRNGEPRCLGQGKLCNGQIDCDDGSDEENCE